MSIEPSSARAQATFWWIASIAAAVLCCAIWFVLFANYLVDVKVALKDNAERINIIQEREDRILTEIELIRKHAVFQPGTPTAAAQAPAAQVPATEAPVSLSVTGANPAMAPAAPVPADKK
jgi:hypothetical protein